MTTFKNLNTGQVVRVGEDSRFATVAARYPAIWEQVGGASPAKAEGEAPAKAPGKAPTKTTSPLED